jgi:hypothetical protein
MGQFWEFYWLQWRSPRSRRTCPVKAAPPPPPLPDWSGVYSGIAAGGAWGRQNLNTPVTPLNNLFGTSADRIFNGSPGPDSA